MAKKRIYVPVEDDTLAIIKAMAKDADRSDVYIANELIKSAIKYNYLISGIEDKFYTKAEIINLL